MKMLQRGFMIAALFIAIVYLTGCMSTKLPESYQVNPEVLEAKGGMVEFTVNGTIPEKSFHKKAVVEFSPYISYDGKTKELKKFTLRGVKTEGEGTVINSATGGSFNYTESFEYTDEMRTGELMVNAKVTKGKKVTEYNNIKLADGIISTYKNIAHDEKTITAPSGYEKVTIVTENASVYFAQNLYNLNWNLALNKSGEAAQKMEKVDSFLKKGWEIKDVAIDAWASPEGEIDFNNNLAVDRAKAVTKFMEKKIDKITKMRAKEMGVDVSELTQQVKYLDKGHGEDWDGFLKAVRDSGLKDKNTILNVVNSQSDAAKREQEIRNMTVIYEEVANEILPSLRRAEIVISCYEPKRTDEEIAELASTDPTSLSYKELLYAATLTDDHEAKYNIYRAGFTHQNRDWKTYNNAAVEAINLRKIDEAENLLGQAAGLASSNGLIENNMGVVAAQNEDYAKAEQHFMTAQGLGEDVNYNLGVINIQKGEYSKALTYFKGMDCKHNIGLAQLLSGEMNESLNNLKCAPESCKTFYALAIYGARTKNGEMVYEYLAKAIEKNPALKAKAKDDREFLKYFNEEAFQAIVK
ncbi:MAG: hypothetical protein K9G76_10515 [Bacteroidales bacterium]|nr:hypothetical protein [Bacteroidales bacterium]MCF8405787.1 hypothetical protein [Bacteroidales bacterium]